MAVDWSPDGTKLVGGGSDGFLQIWDATSGQTLLDLSQAATNIYAVAWSPDGEYIATGSEDHIVRIWRASNGVLEAQLTGHQDKVVALDWHSQGEELASVSSFDIPNLIIWDINNFRVKHSVDLPGIYLFGVRWQPNAYRLAIVNSLGGTAIIDPSLSLEAWYEIGEYSLELEGGMGSVAWNSDGTRLAVGGFDVYGGDVSIHVWDVAQNRLLRTMGTHEGEISSVAWSPDDRLIVSVGLDDTVKVWNAATGSLEDTFAADDVWIRSLRFSPYGGRLAFGGALQTGAAAARVVVSGEGVVQSVAGGAVNIVVPAPSAELLSEIAARCDAPPPVGQALQADLATPDLEAFIAEVETLPAAQLPPACAADLIAVAEALGAGE
jgi:WD40 repeat protein